MKINYDAYRSTLRDCSFDDANNQYMVDIDDKVVNYDQVCKSFCHNKRYSTMKSADALIITSENYCLVEFKNGCIEVDAKKQYEIMQKMYDSVILLSILENISIAKTKEMLDFILVYNDEKNASKDAIVKYIAKKGNTHVIKWGLGWLEGIAFRNVYTFTKEQFIQWYEDNRGRDCN